MTAPHTALFDGLRRRAAAAARLEPLEHSGARDPGNGMVPRREYIEHRPARRADPTIRAVVAARAGGHTVPATVTVNDLRALWRLRPELRPALTRMADHLTTTTA